jgi:hypothetical protein
MYLENILKDGIKPRGKSSKGNWGNGNVSMPDCVYLSDSIATYFAAWCQKDSDTNGSRGLLLEVDTDKLIPFMLLPDEDVLRISLAQFGRQSEIPKKNSFRQWIHLMLANQELWSDSIRAIGTCAYLGHIPPEAITRYATFERDATHMFRYDHSINPMAHQILGSRNREYIRLIFDGEIDAAKAQLFIFDAEAGMPLIPGTEEYEMAYAKEVRELIEHRNKTVEVVSLLGASNLAEASNCG